MQEHVVDLPGLQRLHERQRSARRALHHEPHLRDLRRQPRDLLGLRAEHGLRHQDAAHGRAHLQPRRGRRVHVRPLDLPGQPGLRRLLRAHGEGDEPIAAREGRAYARTARRRPRSPHDRGHHAELQPVHRRDVPRGAADEPPHARDVLPDGRPPRPPVDALPGRHRHGGDATGLHGLHGTAPEVPRLREEGDPPQRRHLRLLLRGAAWLRDGR